MRTQPRFAALLALLFSATAVHSAAAQQGNSTDGDFSCTPVSVKGDATYCISGRVCSGVGAIPPGTSCPKRGDVAIAHCWSTLSSYNAADGRCVAAQDAQCMVIETGVWGCAFLSATPSMVAATTTAPEVGAEGGSDLLVAPTEEARAPSVATELAAVAAFPPIDVASPIDDFPESDNNKDIAAATYDGSPSTATTFTANPGTGLFASVGTVNVIVAVAALVVAAVGVALVRKRQSDRVENTRNNSIRNLNCLELSTPL